VLAARDFPVPERRELAGWDVERGRIGDAGLAGSRDLDNFPAFSLSIRD
jgi:hypothetical protein